MNGISSPILKNYIKGNNNNSFCAPISPVFQGTTFFSSNGTVCKARYHQIKRCKVQSGKSTWPVNWPVLVCCRYICIYTHNVYTTPNKSQGQQRNAKDNFEIIQTVCTPESTFLHFKVTVSMHLGPTVRFGRVFM